MSFLNKDQECVSISAYIQVDFNNDALFDFMAVPVLCPFSSAPTSDATHTFVVRGQNTGSKIAGRKATSQSMCDNGLTLECMILAE